MIKKINELKSTTGSNAVKELCEAALATISSAIYNGVTVDAKFEIERITINNLFEGLSKHSDTDGVKEWLSNQKRLFTIKNLGVRESISSLNESKELSETLAVFKDALDRGIHEARLYEDFITALSPFGYFPTVGNAIKAVKDRVNTYKTDVDIVKILETMKETRSNYLVPLIEDVINNYLSNKNKQTKSQLSETLMKFTYDPFVRDIASLLTLDATELQLEYANAECDIEKVFSPVLYLGENEAVFAVNKTYYIRKGNNISRMPQSEVAKLDEEFKTLCETISDPNIVIDRDGITVYGNKDKAFITENEVVVNDQRMNEEEFGNAQSVAEWAGKRQFFQLVEFLRSNFNEIAEIDFVKRVYLKESASYAADVFKLRDNVFITTHDPKMGKATFYRNVNPIQAKNIMMEHLRFDVTSLYKGLLPDEQKINEQIKETKEEYNTYISDLNERIEQFKANPYKKDLSDKVVEALETELKEVKDEYKDYLNNIERYVRAKSVSEEISINNDINVGDEVIINSNDKDFNYFNGKKGLVKEIDGDIFYIYIYDEDDVINFYFADIQKINNEVNEAISININVDGKKYIVPIPQEEGSEEAEEETKDAGTEVGSEYMDQPASAITFDSDETELIGDTPTIPEDEIDLGSDEAEEDAEEAEEEAEEKDDEEKEDAEEEDLLSGDDDDIKIEDEVDLDTDDQAELENKDKEDEEEDEEEEEKKKKKKEIPLESAEGEGLKKKKFLREDGETKKKKRVFLKKKVNESINIKKKSKLNEAQIPESQVGDLSQYKITQLTDKKDDVFNNFYELEKDGKVIYAVVAPNGDNKFYDELPNQEEESRTPRTQEHKQTINLTQDEAEGAEAIEGGDEFSKRYRLKDGRIIDVMPNGKTFYLVNESLKLNEGIIDKSDAKALIRDWNEELLKTHRYSSGMFDDYNDATYHFSVHPELSNEESLIDDWYDKICSAKNFPYIGKKEIPYLEFNQLNSKSKDVFNKLESDIERFNNEFEELDDNGLVEDEVIDFIDSVQTWWNTVDINDPYYKEAKKWVENLTIPTTGEKILDIDINNLNYDDLDESLSVKKKSKLNESAQIGDTVSLNKQKGFVIGQIGNDLIVQVQGSTHRTSQSDVKVIGVKPEAQNVQYTFDKLTQQNLTTKAMFEQYVKCGIFMGSVPVKMNDCFVRYSDWNDAADDKTVNVMVEGAITVMPKNQIRILEDINSFANLDSYVDGVEIDEATGDAKANVKINAMDYTGSIGDADAVRIIRGVDRGTPVVDTLPKSALRTLAI